MTSLISSVGLSIQNFTADQMASLKRADTASISTAQAMVLSAAQIRAIPPGAFVSLSPEALKVIDGQTLAAAMTPREIRCMSGSQVQALNTLTIASLNASQISILSGSQISALTTTQVQALSPDAVSQINPKSVQSIEIQDIKLLNSAQVAALSSKQVSYLSCSQIAAIDPEDMAAMDHCDIAALSLKQVGDITAAQLNRMANTNLDALSAKQINALSKKTLSDCSDDALLAFDDTQIAALNVDKITIIARRNQTGYYGRVGDNINSPLSNSQIRAIPPQTLAKLGLSEISKLSRTASYPDYALPDNAVDPMRYEGFTQTQLAALSPVQLGGLYLTDDNLRSMTSVEIKKLDNTLTSKFLDTTQYRRVSDNVTTIEKAGSHQVPISTSYVVEENRIKLLSPDAISGLTLPQIAQLKEEHIMALSDDQLRAFTVPQLEHMANTTWYGSQKKSEMFSTEQVGVIFDSDKRLGGYHDLYYCLSDKVAALGRNTSGSPYYQ